MQVRTEDGLRNFALAALCGCAEHAGRELHAQGLALQAGRVPFLYCWRGAGVRDKRMDNRGTAPHELTLIRMGHHLWRAWKASKRQDKALYAALETIWAAKEAIRAELRAKHLASRDKNVTRLRKMGFRRESLGDA
jgi:hypothetical protein